MARIGETTPLPLYSEEEALSYLRSKGYTVDPPLSGEIYVVRDHRNPYNKTYVRQSKPTSDLVEVIAIIPWKQGDGL